MKRQYNHGHKTEEATGREKVGEGAIRKRTQKEIATKLKIVEDKDTKERLEQRNRTEERNIKIGNTYQKPILEEELLPITKIHKEEKKKLKKGEEAILENT